MKKYCVAFVLFWVVFAPGTADWPCDQYTDGEVHYVPNVFNCTIYDRCLDGQRIQLACPDKLVYSVQKQACVYASQSECQSASVLCYGIDNGYVPDPYDCAKFVECYNGSSYSLTCPAGLYYNEDKEQCGDPSQSSCDYSHHATPQPVCAGVSAGQVVLRPDKDDCRKYHVCNGGTTISDVACSGGMYFDETKQSCGPSPVSDCKYDVTSPPNINNSSTTDTSDPRCSLQTQNTLFPHPADCTKYILCNQGKSYEIDCPPKMKFNEHSSSCVTSGDSGCGQEISTVYPQTVPTEWVPKEDCQSDGQLLPYPGNCSRFYKCLNGFKWAQECPSGLYWHQAKQICDYPYLSDCH